MNQSRSTFLVCSLLLVACGKRTPAPSGDSGADSGQDTGTDTGTDTGEDTAPIEVPADNVSIAVGDCLGYYREPEEYPNQLARGNELQRYTLKDPEAVCNDGSRAVMYVRAATDAALANTWSIHLQGGGGCGSYLTCAMRWCGLDYYDSSKMSSNNLPLEIDGFGIYDASATNGLAGANQVFFYYCSSDAWRGEGSAAYNPDGLEIPGDLPVELPDGLPDYTIFRRGHTILASGLDELAGGLVADDGEALPALDAATLVVFNGTSGGSTGARANADYVRERLAPSEVVAIFDAAINPSPEFLSEPYVTALETYRAQGWQQSQETDDVRPFMDETCWDELGGTAEEGQCYNLDYVMMNHITTPFFVRQDLRDLGDAVTAIGLPEDDFERGIADTLSSLADLQSTATEGPNMAVVPGAYGPNCAQHVALESTRWWAESTVEDGAGTEWSFQQGVLAWYGGAAFAVVDEPNTGSADGPSSTCAEVDEER